MMLLSFLCGKLFESVFPFYETVYYLQVVERISKSAKRTFHICKCEESFLSVKKLHKVQWFNTS